MRLSMRCCKNRLNPKRCRLHRMWQVGAIIADSRTMLLTADMPRRAVETLGPQFESLIRLAEAIRRHPDQKDLFQMLADELRHVVPFDAICQVDHAGKKINWHFSEV